MKESLHNIMPGLWSYEFDFYDRNRYGDQIPPTPEQLINKRYQVSQQIMVQGGRLVQITEHEIRVPNTQRPLGYGRELKTEKIWLIWVEKKEGR